MVVTVSLPTPPPHCLARRLGHYSLCDGTRSLPRSPKKVVVPGLVKTKKELLKEERVAESTK
jgi:hypothetical protein